MPFVRITLARPQVDLREQMREHFQELIQATSTMPGFIAGYVLTSTGQAGEVGRVTIWDSQTSANHAANDARVMVIHSKLMLEDRGTLQDWDMDSPFEINRAEPV